MERPGTMKVKCLAQEHNVMTPARAQNQIIMLDLKFLPRGRGGGGTPYYGLYLGRLLYEAGTFGPRDRLCPKGM